MKRKRISKKIHKIDKQIKKQTAKLKQRNIEAVKEYFSPEEARNFIKIINMI